MRFRPRSRGIKLLALLVGLPVVALVVSDSRRTGGAPAVGLAFEANRGQTDPRVDFVARGIGHTVFVTPTEAVLVLAKPATQLVLRMQFLGAETQTHATGLEELPGKANYFVGKDRAQWRTHVPLYGQVVYTGLYPGIDVRYSGDQRQVACEFVVRPGADPGRVSLAWQGADSLELDARGNLLLHTPAGVVRQLKPVIHQNLVRARRDIAGRYVRQASRQVGFAAGAYDATRPLVITSIVPLSVSPEPSRSTSSVR
jgi:hypothetical protein